MKEIFIEDSWTRRIAVKENGILTECHFEEKDKGILPGNLILGVVKNTVVSLSSVFIDIGDVKNGYMFVQDKSRLKDFREGQGILVEVLKEKSGGKGAKVTDKVSIAGKYIVLSIGKGITYSQKLDPEALLERHGNLITVEGYRVLYREASLEASKEDILDEIKELKAAFDEALRKAENGIGPRKIYGDESVLGRVIRDNFTDLNLVYADSEETRDHLKREFSLPSLLHRDPQGLFDFYGIEKEIIKLLSPRVSLAGGGNLVIESTEAMHVIDVNSAKKQGKGSREDSSLELNLVAAAEAVRQIRLRNLFGIIAVDFVDMKDDESRRELLEKVTLELKRDHSKATAYPLTELGIMQIARRGRGLPVRSHISEKCTCCGTGQLLSLEYTLWLIRNELKRELKSADVRDFHIVLNERFRARIEADITGFIRSIDSGDRRIYLTFSGTHEHFILEPLIFGTQIRDKEKYLINP